MGIPDTSKSICSVGERPTVCWYVWIIWHTGIFPVDCKDSLRPTSLVATAKAVKKPLGNERVGFRQCEVVCVRVYVRWVFLELLVLLEMCCTLQSLPYPSLDIYLLGSQVMYIIFFTMQGSSMAYQHWGEGIWKGLGCKSHRDHNPMKC